MEVGGREDQGELGACLLRRAQPHPSVTCWMAVSSSVPDEYLLGQIVDQAGYESTTFLDIFKAYNAVLEQEGIDPAEDTQ